MAAIKHIWLLTLSIIILACFPKPVPARTSLVSLPERQNIAIRLGSQGTALIQEKRILTLKKGTNKINFSWQNVMIDPSSIILTSLSDTSKIKILNISYPPNEAALIWEISSPVDIEEQVMISYLLANIDYLITYTAVTDAAEQTIDLKSFLVLRNFSGENFENAIVTYNSAKPFNTDSRHMETKKILASQNRKIPIKKIYTWDALKMPHDPEKSKTMPGLPTRYEFYNNLKSNLGITPLLKGKARLFATDSQASSIFLGEDMVKFTPIGDRAKLLIGDTRDIVVTQHRIETKRANIKRNAKGKIQVYDEIIKDQITMENMKDQPVILSLMETIQGQWNPIEISMSYEQKDHKTLVFNVKLEPKEKKTLKMHYKILNIFPHKFSQYNRVTN